MRGFEVSAIELANGDQSDAVLDLEINTNRPDCLSVVGIAREVATMYGKSLSWPTLAPTSTGDDLIPVTIESNAHGHCSRYAASVANVTIRSSPEWLTARLEAAGIRPVNNVVDVTNYVMIEFGQPMHAFDLDRLGGSEIRVRLARPEESVQTLDGVSRLLTADTLVIADAKQPQAVAGVMGGANTEVTASTTRVLLESAHFDPISVRRTSKRLCLSTDASYRFERGADINAPVPSMKRAQALLVEIGAGTVTGKIIDCYPEPRKRVQINVRQSRIDRVLGANIDSTFVTETLKRLGFDVKRYAADSVKNSVVDNNDDGQVWSVIVPTHRVDVTREIDLIEEVARHYGYDRLPSTFPAMKKPPDPLTISIDQRRLTRRTLTAAGCSEAITYGFIEETVAKQFIPDGEQLVRIANPLSEKFTVLRPSLLPGLVDSLVYNRRREHADIRLFEIGNRFTARDGETTGIAIAITGSSARKHWSGGDRETDFFDIKGVVDLVCDALGVTPTFEADTRTALMPGRTAAVRTAADNDSPTITLGYVGQLSPAIATLRGQPTAADAIYVAELSLDLIAGVAVDRRMMISVPLPRHPSIVRDIAIVIASTLPASTVRGTIQSVAPDTLLHVREFDRYAGEGIPDGSVGLAFRLTFRASDRTLTDAEVQQTIDAVVAKLEATHQATLR